MGEIMSKHQKDMEIIQERFAECDQIHERLTNLNSRINKSNINIAKTSEKEKKLAVFLVDLNNKLFK